MGVGFELMSLLVSQLQFWVTVSYPFFPCFCVLRVTVAALLFIQDSYNWSVIVLAICLGHRGVEGFCCFVFSNRRHVCSDWKDHHWDWTDSKVMGGCMCDKRTYLSLNKKLALWSLLVFSLPSFVGVPARKQEGSFLPVDLRCLLFAWWCHSRMEL